MREYLRSKIHKATVTEADLHYVGSISIDRIRRSARNLRNMNVVDNSNGARMKTYVIKGPRNSGMIGINGAAAHLIHKGDEIISMAFRLTDKRPAQPVNVLVDEKNSFKEFLDEKFQMRDADGC